MPSLNSHEFLAHYERIINARCEILNSNIKFLNQCDSNSELSEEILSYVKTFFYDIYGYSDDAKIWHANIAKHKSLAEQNTGTKIEYSILLDHFELALKFYKPILDLVRKYQTEPGQRRKQKLIDEIVSYIYDGLCVSKLLRVGLNAQIKKSFIADSIKYQEKLPEGFMTSSNFFQENFSETEQLEDLFNYLKSYASPEQHQSINFLNRYVEEAIRNITKSLTIQKQAPSDTSALTTKKRLHDNDNYLFNIRDMYTLILNTLAQEAMVFYQQSQILSLTKTKDTQEIKSFQRKLSSEYERLANSLENLDNLRDTLELKIQISILWQQLHKFTQKLDTSTERLIQHSALQVQEQEQSIAVQQEKVQPQKTSASASTPKQSKAKPQKAMPEAAAVSLSVNEDPLFAQQANEKLKLQAQALELQKEQEIIKEAAKLAAIEELNKQARLKKEQERLEKALLFTEPRPLATHVPVIEQASTSQQIELLSKLSAQNLKKLEEILNAPGGSIDLKFTYENIAAIAVDLGAKIKKGSGSRRKFVFSVFDFDTYEPSRVVHSLHSPHGRSHETGALFGVYVEQFITSLNKLGINKVSLDDYKNSQQPARLVH